MSLTNERFQIKTYPSPFVTDVIFYEIRDSVLPKNKQPEYGDPHPNSALWPNHFLVSIQPAPRASDGKQMWWYAATRDSQDEYNWSFSEADIGGNKFDAVVREYVVLRSEFSSTVPDQGDAMPNTPTGKFSGTHVLSVREQVQSREPELNSMFVFERRTYVKKVTLTDIEIDPSDGDSTAIERTLYYRGEIVTGSSTIEALVASPSNAYWDSDANGFARTCEQISENWFLVTYKKYIDKETEWLIRKDRLRPERYYCPKDTTTTTTIIPNSAAGPPAEPGVASGSAVEVKQKGTIKSTTTTTQAGDPKILKGLNLLPDDGITYPFEDELVLLSAVPTEDGGVDGDGVVVEYDPIDGCNASKKTRKAVSLEDEWKKESALLYPEKFIPASKVATTIVTETGDLGEPATPPTILGTRASVDQKGRVRKTATTEQDGEPEPLLGLDYNASDGTLYQDREEVVPLTSVPAEEELVGADGKAIIYQPINADFAVKRTVQAVSIKPEYVKLAAKMAPDRFMPTGKQEVLIETTTGSEGEPTVDTPDLQQSRKVKQKGALLETEVTTQTEAPAALRSTSFDQRTGETHLSLSELVEQAEVAESAIDADGRLIFYRNIDAVWAERVTEKVASTLSRSWTEVINYEWPPVLKSIIFKSYAAKRGRGSVVYPIPRFKKGFSGPQLVNVTQYWQKDSPTVVPPNFMIPEGFSYACPTYNVSVPPCLHGEITLGCNIGTEDPEWEFAVDSETFEATNYVDWPESIFWRESQPYRGGYLVTEWTINSPS